jgi:hypothetical protein
VTPAATLPSAATPPAVRLDRRLLELGLRVAGAAVAVWGGVLLALLGAFLTPLRVGTVPVPVCLLLAVGGNAALIWFAYRATGHRFPALLPGLVWVVLSVVASGRTSEGDVVLYQQNWVSLVYLLAGSATVTVAAYRLIVRRPEPPAPPPPLTSPTPLPPTSRRS